METPPGTETLNSPPDRQQAALVTLLADEDPEVHEAVRAKILSLGPRAAQWLRPHTLSGDPLLRRRARELIHHFEQASADNAFLGFCLRHGEDFNLEEAAWLLARTEYPGINTEAYQALLDSYAGELQQRISLYKKPGFILGQVNDYLFHELGFTGNEQDYYDPENSYLNRVLDRRTGNPIALCLLYLLMARRLHLPVAGIALPGHFLCRYQSSTEEIYIDVFNRGRQLTRADCVHHLVRGHHSLADECLRPDSPRRMLHRLCSHLHQVYRQLEMPEPASRFLRYLRALAP